MTTKTLISDNTFINDIDGLCRVYNDCACQFLNDKIGFFKKVVEFSNKGKNHLDVAKYFSWPRHLVRHILETANNGIDDDMVEISENFILDNEPILSEFKKLEESKNLVVFIEIDDSTDDFFVNYNQVELRYPYEFPDYLKNYLVHGTEKELKYIDVFSNGFWQIALEVNGQDEHVNCQNMDEKKETLEMLRYMKKYLH